MTCSFLGEVLGASTQFRSVVAQRERPVLLELKATTLPPRLAP